MTPKKIWAMYFSPTGGTRKITLFIAQSLAQHFKEKVSHYNFTLPKMRKKTPTFAENEVVVFGMPVYAGRVPNLFLPYVESLKGNGAFALPVVSYGARAFDDALIELRDLLEKSGFRTVGGAAMVSLHAFSTTLGKGRPSAEDFKAAEDFALKLAEKIKNSDFSAHNPVFVEGQFPYRAHMRPKNAKGEPISFLPVKTVTNDSCTDCKICAKLCPLGSIDLNNVKTTPGKCIKCNACVKKCPQHAKSFEDAGYLYHKEELEELYQDAVRSPSFFL